MCDRLCAEMYYIPADRTPSDQQLLALEQHANLMRADLVLSRYIL